MVEDTTTPAVAIILIIVLGLVIVGLHAAAKSFNEWLNSDDSDL